MPSESNYWDRVARNRYSRRRVLTTVGIGGAALGGLTLLGCGDDDDDDDATPSGSPGASQASEAPKKGGSVVVGSLVYPILPVAAKPQYISTAYMPTVFSQLVQENPANEGEIIPDLAVKWEQPSPTEHIFRLRPGVTWHNGDPFTAQDVVYSVERITDKQASFVDASQGFAPMQSVEAVDNATVRFKLSRPSYYFFTNLANTLFPIHSAKTTTENPVGTGPYKITKQEPGTRIELTRNPSYWGAEKVYLDTITHQVFNYATELNALRAKQVQISMNVRPGTKNDYDILQSDYEIHRFLGTSFRMVFQNKPPFNDDRIRKAFHLAIDRQRMLDLAFQGGGGVIAGYQFPGSPWATPQDKILGQPGYRKQRDEDIKEAKRLLEAVGVAGSNFPKVDIMCWNIAQAETEIWQGLMKQDLGIELPFRALDRAPFTEALATRNFNLNIGVSFAPGFDPVQWLSAYFHTKGPRNRNGFGDAAMDAKLEEMDTILDQKKRITFSQDLEQQLIEKSWDDIIAWRDYYQAVAKNVRGYPKGLKSLYSNRLRYDSLSIA